MKFHDVDIKDVELHALWDNDKKRMTHEAIINLKAPSDAVSFSRAELVMMVDKIDRADRPDRHSIAVDSPVFAADVSMTLAALRNNIAELLSESSNTREALKALRARVAKLEKGK